MKIASQSTLLLSLAFYFFLLHNSSLVASDAKITSSVDSGYKIGIDCGSTEEEYLDSENNMWYKPDSGFVETGQNHKLPSDYSFSNNKSQMWKQLNTLRSFPDGKRNCYTLTATRGRNYKYIVRAFFAYGNYDRENTTPVFDLYLGVNHWKTIEFDDVKKFYSVEVILVALTDTISVCLVNTGNGDPIISSLELWPLGASTYPVSPSLPWDLSTRSTPGRKEDVRFIRFKDDIHGRVWFTRTFSSDSRLINTSVTVDLNGKQNPLDMPPQVLKTAIESTNNYSSLAIYYDQLTDSSDKYFFYFYFFEFDQNATTQKRIMNITINGNSIRKDPITTEHLKLVTIPYNMSITPENQMNISITRTQESKLPAMINAFEVYKGLKLPNQETHQDDADAMRRIKSTYNIINWQGDPCIPKSYAWEGVTCTDNNVPSRITSLNLSSRGLTGKIDASFLKLTKLTSLDLSYNSLTGEVPDFRRELPDLKFLDLTGNQLTGSKKNKYVIPLVASIAAFIAVLAMGIVIYQMNNKRIKRKKQGVRMPSFRKDGNLKSKNRTFDHFQVLSITNDFETVIGEGGFGKVYLGTLQDGTQVAVKLLSKSSQQGFKEFQSEAELLMVVHHKNLVSLVGYCNDGDMKALVYEYMVEGNLQQKLSDKNPCALKWNERIQIALDAACGLDYLHNGCKPSIIHRDVKTSNILLSKNMQAKIADFGLSRAFSDDTNTQLSTRLAGTIGYLDPEYHSCGSLNKKSDVYSFGIILLELMTGRPAVTGLHGHLNHISDWVAPRLQSGDIQSIMDPRLEGNFHSASAWKFLEIAMSCIPPVAIQRPDMGHVVADLKECLALEMSLQSAESNSANSSSSLSITYFPLESNSAPCAR